MKHVTFLTYPLLVTGLTALSVGGCSSNATNTSQSSGQSSAQASGSSGSGAEGHRDHHSREKRPTVSRWDSRQNRVRHQFRRRHGVNDRRRPTP